MKKTESMEAIQTRRSDVTVAGTRVVDSKRKAELRKSIEASTARLVTIAMSRDPDSDPEAA
jgi:hypothetical protein